MISKDEYLASFTPGAADAVRKRAQEVAAELNQRNIELEMLTWTTRPAQRTIEVHRRGLAVLFGRVGYKKEIVQTRVPKFQAWHIAEVWAITGEGTGRGSCEGFYRWSDHVVLTPDGELWKVCRRYEEHAGGPYRPPNDTVDVTRLGSFEPRWDALNVDYWSYGFWGTFENLWNKRFDEVLSRGPGRVL